MAESVDVLKLILLILEKYKMSDDSKFWISVNAIVGIVFISIIFLSTSYWKDHNAKIVNLIKLGVDPVVAMCAMQDDYGNTPVCVIAAVKGVSK